MKPRIAIIGANGQVGAELCLVLRNFDDISIVPIVRSRRGSSYLRWKGVACRHGSVADAAQAAGLIGDCDLVLNLALPAGLPRDVRKENRDIIENCARYAKPGARIVYFSTQSVYGAAAPDQRIRWRNGYGLEKFRGETDARHSAGRNGRQLWILRLGHVCGELQGISQNMRQNLKAGPIRLADGGSHLSNCTNVATIAAAALALLGDCDAPGTYDLMDVPHRTWREINEWEASRAGVAAEIEAVAPRRRSSPLQAVKSVLMAPLRGRATNPLLHELGLQVLALLPSKWGTRLQADYFKRRASSEIAAIGRRDATHEASDWLPVPGPFFARNIDTGKCLADGRFFPQERSDDAPFPEDLPNAGS